MTKLIEKIKHKFFPPTVEVLEVKLCWETYVIINGVKILLNTINSENEVVEVELVNKNKGE